MTASLPRLTPYSLGRRTLLAALAAGCSPAGNAPALGPQGLKETAELCLRKAHYAAEELIKVPGLSRAFDRPFFKEFVVTDLQDPAPPGWAHIFLDDHPPPLTRVEQADAFERLNR